MCIPTKPQSQSDTGFINLPALKSGKSLTFRLPWCINQTWLREYNWLGEEEILAPFVESFKLYLPPSKYGQKHTKRTSIKTRIQLTSISVSLLSDTSDVVRRNITLKQSNFLTVFYHGYTSFLCPNKNDINNPYSLCENLPKLCDTITRVPQARGRREFDAHLCICLQANVSRFSCINLQAY